MKKGLPGLSIVLLLGIALRLGVLFKPFALLDDLVLCDDTYITLDIARRWAGGDPMTQDGIHKTNGFQPLWVFLLIPIFKFLPSDPILPVRIALGLSALLSLGTGLLFFPLTRTLGWKEGGLFLFFLWMVSPGILHQSLNGMETSLAAFFLALALWYYLGRIRGRDEKSAEGSPWLLGVLLGLALLARVDSAFFLLILFLDGLWVGRTKALPLFWRIGSAAFLVFSPWLLLSWAGAGSLIPTSGLAVRFQSLALVGMHPDAAFYLRMLRRAFGQVINVPLPLGDGLHLLRTRLGLPRLVFYIPVAFFILLALWAFLHRARDKARDLIKSFWVLALFPLVLSLFYVFYVLGHWHYDRYFHPVAFFLTLGYGWVFSLCPKTARAALWALAALLVLPGLWGKEFGGPSGAGSYPITGYVQASFPPGTRIGTYQSGAIGYFARDKTVINLDGVVNATALRAHMEKRAWRYLRDEGIEYVLDWELNFRNMLLPMSGKPWAERERAWKGTGIHQCSQTWVVLDVKEKNDAGN